MARKKAAEEPAEPEKVKLTFNQSLKAPNNAELLKRLKALHRELEKIDQDAIDTSSLDKVAKELINNTLLLHKEKAVKAFLATCLVDILRLYAPEPPYTDLELRDIFQFLTRQLKFVGDPTDAHAPEYFYTLESLANVKSIVIICDLEQAEEMMTDLFKQSFDVVSSSTSKNVELNIADLLVQVLEEADPIPQAVVDTLLVQFLPKNVKLKPSAFSLVKDVCSAAADKLQRHVVQYFAEIITATIGGDLVTSDDESDNESDAKGKSKRKKKKGDSLPTDFVVAHTLIRQINRSVPNLLLSVVPLLEKELEEEKVEFRKLATETLVAMCGEKIGQGDVAKRYPHVWRSLIKRSVDVSPVVRLALVNGLGKVWKEHQELSKDIEAVLGNLLLDGDEKIRLATVQLFAELEYETAFHHVGSTMLRKLGDRCRDSKPSVRAATLSALGRLYNLAYQDIESKDEQVVKHFGWIPTAIVDTLSLVTQLPGQNSLRALLDSVLLKDILPLPDKDEDESAWVDRFLVVFSSLPPAEQSKLLHQSRLQERRPSWWDVYIEACEKDNGGLSKDEHVKAQLEGSIQAASSRLPDTDKAREALAKFAKSNEKQLFKIMRTILDPATEVKNLAKNQKEALRRIEQISSSLVDTFTAFIHAASYFYLNRSSISPLMKRASNAKDEMSEVACSVLTFMAKNRPDMFKAHNAELVRAVSESSSGRLAEIALHATAEMLKKSRNGNERPTIDKKMSDRCKHFAKHGDVKQSKYAATALALDRARSSASSETIGELSGSLNTADDSELPSILAALARFAHFDKDSYQEYDEQVMKATLAILHSPLKSAELVEEDVAWFEDDEVPPRTQARELCLKVMTNFVLAYADAKDLEGAQRNSKSVFELLWKFVLLTEDTSDFNAPVVARLRLAASLAVLKLAPYPCFQDDIAKNFLLLTRPAQDMSFEVRSGYIRKLLAYLRSGRIAAPRYNMLLFLVAHDPEDDLRLEVESYVRHMCSRLPHAMRMPKWEHPFMRLIHMLAHHPDFAHDVVHDDAEELKVMARYLQWYLELVATRENISYLFQLAQIIKTTRDRYDPSGAYDRNLYTMSELAQYLITQHAKASSWPLETRPSDVKVPIDVFAPIKDTSELKRINSKAYIASDLLTDVQVGKTSISATAKGFATSRAKATAESKPNVAGANRKRSSPSAAKSRPRKQVKKKSTAGDKWDPSKNESDEEDVISLPTDSEEEEEQENKGVQKKAKSPTPAAKKGTRRGLRNGSAKANVADEEDEASAGKARKAQKGLAVPRKMRVRDNELERMSDMDSDEEMQSD